MCLATFSGQNCAQTKTFFLFLNDSWGGYGFCQGTAAFALFCIGHECGHGSFFGNRFLDDAVGLMVHSVVLIPYYSWQFTHGKHHAKTAHLVDNSAHNPSTRAEMRMSILAPWVFNLIGETCYTALRIMLYLLFGWPVYLFTSIEGARRGQLSKATPHAILDHFRPSSKLFPGSWSFRVQLSTLGCGLVVAGLCLSGACIQGGFARIILLYGLPYPFFTSWLIMYTWLHHTHEDVPMYGDTEWTFVKGALSTVDRPLSKIHSWILLPMFSYVL